jgi:hypothetical protein
LKEAHIDGRRYGIEGVHGQREFPDIARIFLGYQDLLEFPFYIF